VNISNINRYNGDLDGRFDGLNPVFEHQHGDYIVQLDLPRRHDFRPPALWPGSVLPVDYTYGKVLTDAEAEQGVTSYYDANNRPRSFGRGLDVRQRMTSSGVWEFLFYAIRQSRKVARAGSRRLRCFGRGPADARHDQRVLPYRRLHTDNNMGGDRPNAPISS
jgi:hypothetical protein